MFDPFCDWTWVQRTVFLKILPIIIREIKSETKTNTIIIDMWEWQRASIIDYPDACIILPSLKVSTYEAAKQALTGETCKILEKDSSLPGIANVVDLTSLKRKKGEPFSPELAALETSKPSDGILRVGRLVVNSETDQSLLATSFYTIKRQRMLDSWLFDEVSGRWMVSSLYRKSFVNSA